MHTDTAKKILLALLAEKNSHLPEDADMREVIAGALDCELLPGGLARSLEQIFTATADTCAADDVPGKADDTKP